MSSSSLNSALVRFLTDGQSPRQPVGAGFLITPQHVVTCAHVVNDALGRRQDAAEQPDLPIFLDFPLLNGQPLVQAKMLRWHPVQADAVIGELEDIAILELLPDSQLPAEAEPAPLEVLEPHEVRMCGFPRGVDHGTYANGALQGLNAKGWVEIHHQGSELVEEGFSGTAVWSMHKNAVCGMAVSVLRRGEATVAYMIPAAMLLKAFPEMPLPVNPYKGLEAFRKEDARFYFGREEETAQLRKIVERQPFTAVIGASGSGKSSLVFAGLLPALPEDTWIAADCRPQQNPFHELARCLFPLLYNSAELDELERLKKIRQCAADLLSGELKLAELFRRILEKQTRRRFLLIVDQFEELHTMNPDKAAARAFVAQLLEAAQIEGFSVVVTLRADFLEAAVSDEAFAKALNAWPPLILSPMDKEKGLRLAVEQPAALQHVSFEPGLAELIVADLGDEPGSLPLLEFCLTQLWERQEGRQITHAAYQETGGVQDALARHADEVFGRLKPEDKERVRHIFLKLVRPGQGTEDTRQVAEFSFDGEQEEQRRLITELAGAKARLLVASGDERSQRVEVVHEALIRHWQTLRGWVNREREFLVWREKLKVLLQQWTESGELLRGLPLDQALKWQDSHAEHLEAKELRFIRGSETARKKQRRRKNIAVAAGLLIAAAVAVVFFILWKQAEQQKGIAENNYKQAKANELAGISAKLKENGDCTLAIRVAQEAYEINPEDASPTAEQALIDSYNKAAMKESFFYQHVLNHENELTWAVYSPDGHAILTASLDGTAKIWSYDGNYIKTLDHNGSPLAQTIFGSDLTKAIFSPDGSRIATSGSNKLLKIWSAKGDLIKDLQGHGCDESSFCNVTNIVFSPDSERMVSVGCDRSVILWDKDGNMLHKEINSHDSFIYLIDFSPDGSKFLTAALPQDSTIKLWDGHTGKYLAEIEVADNNDPCTECGFLKVLFSADGQRVVAASRHYGIRIFDLQGKILNIFDKKYTKNLNELILSPDGKGIATGAKDGEVIEWNEDGTIRHQFPAHNGAVNQLMYSPDGRFLLSAGADRLAKLWDESRQLLINYQGHKDVVKTACFSPDQRYVLTSSSDHTARVWSTNPISSSVFFPYKGGVKAARFLPDEQRILVGVNGIREIPGNSKVVLPDVVLWDMKKNLAIQSYGPYGIDDYGNPLLFSLDLAPDGKRFVVTCADYFIRIHDVETGKVIKQWDGGFRESCVPSGWCGASSAVYSPDGSMIATSDRIGNVAIWDADGNQIRRFKVPEDRTYALAFSPDSKYLLTGGNTVKYWTVKGEMLRQFTDHTKDILCMAFSPDGQWIATSSQSEHVVRIRHIEGKQPTMVLKGHNNKVKFINFSLDGNSLLTASSDLTAKIWDRQGRMIRTLSGHNNPLNTAFFSPSATTTLTASEDNEVRIWNINAHDIHKWLKNANIYNLTAEERQEFGIAP